MAKLSNIPGAIIHFSEVIAAKELEHIPFRIIGARKDVQVRSANGNRVCVVFDIILENGEARALFLTQDKDGRRAAVADFLITNPGEYVDVTLHTQKIDEQRTFIHLVDWDDLEVFIAELEAMNAPLDD